MAKDITTDVTPQVSTWVQQLKELAINNGLNCVYCWDLVCRNIRPRTN